MENTVLNSRLQTLPPYLAAELNARVSALTASGADVINLSIGSPDTGPDPRIVAAAGQRMAAPDSHGYMFGGGIPAFREAVAGYMRDRFGVTIDPATQVLALMGSKEALAHLPLGLCDPGDVGVYPDPGYPAYRPGLHLAGAEPVALPLDPDQGWRPRWDELEKNLCGTGPLRLVILNYPHNPTSATAGSDDFDEAIRWARGRGAVLLNDNAYADIGFDGYRPPSLLQAPEAGGGAAGSRVIELHSMSKTFSMAGWRCGFAVGDPELIALLARIKNYYDSGLFAVVQQAGAAALELAAEIAPAVSARYQARRDLLKPALEALGLETDMPVATIYLWARLGGGETDDLTWCSRLLEESHVVLCPGQAFGARGRGYVRFSLTAPEDRLEEAAARLSARGGA
jgi:LL-diaminopimelate aminotransferase